LKNKNKKPWAGIVKPIKIMKNLGKHGKDVITGFEGTVTSEHHYLTGCTQYGLQPKIKKDGTLGDTMYFDENRIEFSGDAIELKIEQEAERPKRILSGCDSRERP
jgi:hypothetical protein